MKKLLLNLVVDSAILSCWYFGLYEGVEGLVSIAVFYMWASVVGAFAFLFLDPNDIFKGKEWHNPLSIAGDIAFIVIAVFHGFIILASFYSFATIIVTAKKQSYIEKQKELDNE